MDGKIRLWTFRTASNQIAGTVADQSSSDDLPWLNNATKIKTSITHIYCVGDLTLHEEPTYVMALKGGATISFGYDGMIALWKVRARVLLVSERLLIDLF
jgi:hypothetical protein